MNELVIRKFVEGLVKHYEFAKKAEYENNRFWVLHILFSGTWVEKDKDYPKVTFTEDAIEMTRRSIESHSAKKIDFYNYILADLGDIIDAVRFCNYEAGLNENSYYPFEDRNELENCILEKLNKEM